MVGGGELMQVLLINPCSSFLEQPDALPPLGLLYLGAALEAHGFAPKVADLNLPGSLVAGHNPGLIGIPCTTATYSLTKDLIAQCRLLYPGVPVVVGGPHITVRPGDYTRLGADAGAVGDCEHWIVSAARRAAYVTQFPILSLLSPNGTVNVDECWWPARHLIPITEYSQTLNGRRSTSMVTARGCPFSCAFCSRWDASRKIRVRSIPNIVREIEKLKTLGFDALAIHDDEINLWTSRLLDLCAAMEPLKVRFKSNARADLLTEDQAEALKSAGCDMLAIGVESGSGAILQTMRKGTTPAINSRARAICRQAGIKFKAFVMVGLPGETEDTVQETRRWLIDNEVDDLTVTMFIPYPGTHIYDYPEQYDLQFSLHYENASLPFRGATGLRLPRVTRTTALSSERLAELPEILEADVRQALGIVQ